MPSPLEEISTPEPHIVQVWQGNAWTKVQHLRCLDLRRTVQPNNGISRATLEYEYGEISTDGGDFALVSPLGTPSSLAPNILQNFVRVGVLDSGTGQLIYWVGVMVAVQDRDFVQPAAGHSGDLTIPHDAPHPRGTQIIECSGPEYVLNRKQVLSSQVATTGIVNRAIPFNIVQGRLSTGSAEQFGNKDNSANAFAKDPNSNAEVWKAGDIAKYLLDNGFFPAVLQSGGPALTWTMANETVLNTFTPAIDVHGQTLYQVLGQLANPRRWTHYRIDYIPDVSDAVFGTFHIVFNSSTSQNISLPSTATIVGNSNTTTLQTSGTIDGRISLLGDVQQRFARVLVSGARKGIICTVDVNGDFLGEGWTSQELAKYNAGAQPVATSWPADMDKQQELNRNYRINQYGKVFTRFVCPTDADFSTLSISTPQYVPGLRWQRHMPLKVGWDYSVNPPVARDDAPDKPEFRTLESLYEYETDLHAYGDSLPAVLEDELTATATSVVTRPLDDTFGVSIRPRKQPHWQANGDLTAIQDRDTEVQPRFDYKNDIKITGYFQTDDYALGQWPSGALANDADTIVIRLGDIAFDDTLLQGTIVDLQAGTAKTAPATIKVRDDTPLLNDIARLAWQWYGIMRYAYTLSYAQVLHDVLPGQVAVNIDGASTDVLITDVAWDFRTMSTHISTGYAEPDFRALAVEALT